MEIKQLTLAHLTQALRIEQDAPDAWTRAQLADTLQNPLWLCEGVWEQNELLGHCLMQLAGDTAEIHAVTVAAAHRRRGAAQALLAACAAEAAAHGAARLLLEVRESNAAARALYQKTGFTALGVRKNFYAQPAENAIIMEKPI